MNSPQPPGQPLISNPQDSAPDTASLSGVIPGDWASAPKMVKGWGWQLAILGAVLLPCFIYFAVKRDDGSLSSVGTLAYILAWFIELFLVYGIRQGKRSAWFVQIALSLLSLTNCPLGTLLHGYLLSQWFKPEVKAWFGVH